ncbi:MAG: YkuS family protein [Clostridia bacterium]|jgi:hypothetical protein
MVKRIAYQRGLETIAAGLQERGYIVFEYGTSQEPYDVLLYDGAVNSAFYQTLDVNAPYMHDMGSAPGVFLVNTSGKSLEEIAHILERKSYSPLF